MGMFNKIIYGFGFGFGMGLSVRVCNLFFGYSESRQNLLTNR